jgi:hypothetical protein
MIAEPTPLIARARSSSGRFGAMTQPIAASVKIDSPTSMPARRPRRSENGPKTGAKIAVGRA